MKPIEYPSSTRRNIPLVVFIIIAALLSLGFMFALPW